MKKALAVAVATAAVLGGTVAAASPASAATNPSCVTSAEWKKVRHGMTLTQVASVIGGQGTVVLSSRSSGYSFVIRQHRVCGQPYGIAQVSYAQGRVTVKVKV